MTRVVRDFGALALIFVLTTATAWAQLATAELNGRVTDSSGGVLPGVTVTATQTATGLVRTAVTDDNGAYLLSNLPTGPYRLEVALQGFRTYVQTGIVLQVGATPTINAALELGSVEETVTVEAAAPIVDVRSAGISDVVENERIVELPLQGRQVTDLLVLSGAAVQTGSVSARGMPGGVTISVAGGLSTGVSYTLDGAPHNNPQQNANHPLPFPDALQEFRVATSGLSAQNGFHSGASVNAITKSGTNRFAGNGFEFLRHHALNSTSRFALIGPDGKRADDGLKRHQFGGTIGGPILRDRLFFFGAFQATMVRVLPSDNIAYVPTAAMLAGDFTAVTSAACNGGRAITLTGPFAGTGNRINPAQFSRAGLNFARKFPTSTDPCGEIAFGVSSDRDDQQAIGKVDYQLGADHSLFGRYMIARFTAPPGYSGEGDNILKTNATGVDNVLHSTTFGETTVFSSSMVNAIRVGVNKGKVDNFQTPFFSPRDIGANIYSYLPGYMSVSVTPGFQIYSGTNTKALFFNDTYQIADDLTLIRGNHQISVGGSLQYWKGDYTSTSRANGNWIFDGRATGLGWADVLVGRVTTVEHGGLGKLPVNSWFPAIYAQDAWRASSRVTVNAGLRWEPFFGQNVENGVISVFNMENFQRGIKSKVFLNAPAGLLYDGDEGFPDNGRTGLDVQWWNLSPRFGVAWDVHGDGRLAVRSSYAMAYDFMAGEYHNINANAPPFGNRSLITDPVCLFDDPYCGRDPHPITTGPTTEYPGFGTFGTMDPGINSPRIQSWNVMVERQLGTQWGVSAAYLGSHSDRLWAQVALNPGVYMGLGPCVINGVSYSVCSTNANLNQRRLLYQQNPREAALIGALDLNTDVGYQNYRGLKLSAQRRAPGGLNINSSYTWSQCKGTPTATGFNQQSAGYLKPEDPSFDAGYCDQDRTHLATLTTGFETPEFGGAAMRAIAAHWRLSGIISARSGSRLNITSGRDNAFTGLASQRVNKVSDDFYAAERTLNQYFNLAAFAQPALGTLGDLERNAAVGPNFWNIDLAVSRLISVSATQRLELRLESFNLLNHFNWGNPGSNFNAGTFGRINSQAGDPRIIQFGIKYDF
jgi:hypothetical protein